MPRQVSLPADQKVVIISDMHIGDGPTESFAGKDETFRRFLDFVATRADALVIAGDGLDFAQALTTPRLARRHRRLLDDLQALAADMPVTYLQGNHDVSATRLRELLDLDYATALVIGDGVRIEHGNAFDPWNQPGDRGAFWASRVHALIERIIRAPVRVPMRKHYRWSTRLGHYLFYRYGQWVAWKEQHYRRQGNAEQARHCREFLDYWGRGEWGDPNGLLPRVESFMLESPVQTLVCGHSHQPGVLHMDWGTYVNCGSWTFADTNYALYDAGHLEVWDFETNRRIEDEEYRGILGAGAGVSFFEWWMAFYRGWLRYDVDAMDQVAHGQRPAPIAPHQA